MIAFAAFAVGAATSSAQAQCTSGWDTSLGNPSGRITASLTYDDGTGPALYVGYSGHSLGGKILGGVAKLQGQQWVALGNGIREDRWLSGITYRNVYDVDYYFEAGSNAVPIVHDIVEFDPDGTGPQRSVLVVAVPLMGRFDRANTAVSSWDGTQWTSMGSGLLDEVPFSSHVVNALAVFDSGSGPKLYATGEFIVTNAAGQQFYGVAVWDGARWQPVGSDGFVTPTDANPYQDGKDLLVHDDGSGPALYVAGVFSGITQVPGTANLARWNGSTWSSVGGGRPGPLSVGVRQLVAFDDDGSGGAGSKLYAVDGSIYGYGGLVTGSLSAWSGLSWSPSVHPTAEPIVLSASVFDDGSGQALYIGGRNLVGDPTARLFRYDGSTFTQLGDGVQGTHNETSDPWSAGIFHLAVHNVDGINRLIAGGFFKGTLAAPVSGNLMWNGSNWVPLLPLGAPIGDITTFNNTGIGLSISSVDLDGDGPQAPALMAAGEFRSIGGVPISGGLARRQGAGWTTLIDHFPFTPASDVYVENKVHVEHKSTGDEVYVATTRRTDVLVGGVYQLVGNDWAPLGDGLATLGIYGLQITGLLSADLGAGSRLYAYGGFDSIGGSPVSKVASWSGSAWEAVGSVPPLQAPYTIVESAAVGNDGTGVAIYLAGRFVGDQVVKWNGTDWSSASAGLPERSDPNGNYMNPIPTLVTLNGSVYAWFAGGREPACDFGPYVVEGVLYALNNGVWTEVGTPTNGYVYTSIIGVANPGDGERLYFNYHTEDYEPYPGPGGSMNVCHLLDTDHAGIVEYDGESFIENPTFGRFVNHRFNTGNGMFPSSVVSVPEADGSTSLWFTGMTAVGATDPAELRGPLVGISSGGLARFVLCPPTCPADLDNGSGTGTPDGGVDINDLLFFLVQFEAGAAAADLDNGTGTGTPDGGVDINDLLFFLVHFEAGC